MKKVCKSVHACVRALIRAPRIFRPWTRLLAGNSNTPGHVPLYAIQRIWQLLTPGFLLLGALLPRLLLRHPFCSRRRRLSLKMPPCSAKALPPPLPTLKSVSTTPLHQAKVLEGQRQLPKVPRYLRYKVRESGGWSYARHAATKGTWPRRAEAMHLPVRQLLPKGVPGSSQVEPLHRVMMQRSFRMRKGMLKVFSTRTQMKCM